MLCYRCVALRTCIAVIELVNLTFTYKSVRLTGHTTYAWNLVGPHVLIKGTLFICSRGSPIKSQIFMVFWTPLHFVTMRPILRHLWYGIVNYFLRKPRKHLRNEQITFTMTINIEYCNIYQTLDNKGHLWKKREKSVEENVCLHLV